MPKHRSWCSRGEALRCSARKHRSLLRPLLNRPLLSFVHRQESLTTDTGNKLEAESVNASQAFEVFAGKAYATSAAGFSDAVSVASQAKELTIVGTSNATPGEKETPLQRLLRLQHEAKELALEVGASQDKSDTADDFPANIASEVEALQKQLQALQTSASAGAGFDPNVQASKALRVQADLSSRMMQAASKGAE